MAGMPTFLSRAADGLARRRGLLLPALLAGSVLAVLAPLPAFVVDVLLVASLALAAVVLLAAAAVPRPMDLSAFPTVLLAATLGRLVVGVAAARLVLTCGEGGLAPEAAARAAGRLAWGVGEFLASASPAAALGVFVLLVLIHLLVVAKGAARTAEVAARFALDALPGKQMAIDSDAAAGLISDDEARLRRRQVSREADFYAAMDGASKFLWGDAVAAVLIAAVCLVGGLYVGSREFGWGWAESASLFPRLAVGVGLLIQVPAMLLAVAASLLVGRSAERADLGEQFVGQLFARPVILAMAAGMVASLLLTPLPKAPLLLVAAGLGGGAWALRGRSEPAGEDERPAAPAPPSAAAGPEEDVARLLAVDPLRLDLGYALVGWVMPGAADPRRTPGAAGEAPATRAGRMAATRETPPPSTRGGELLDSLASLRSRLAQELGLIVPPIRIRDEKSLEAHSYAIYVRGARVADGQIYANLLLAVGDGEQQGGLLGRSTRDPVFGTPAVWIQPDQRDQAEAMHYVVISPLSVLVTHLGEVIRTHAGELLTREQTARLLDVLKRTAPVVVGEVAARLQVGQIQAVLQHLLREQVPIRDLEAILEAVADAAAHTQDPAILAERARSRLWRTLGQRYRGEDGRLRCVRLRADTEEALGRYVAEGAPLASAIPPEACRKLALAVGEALADLERQGRPPVVVCGAGVRSAVQKLITPSLPRAVVLGTNELESVEVESVATIGTDL